MTAAQEMIGRQLALRAVVWDIWDMHGVDAKRLEEEMQLFKVRRIQTADDRNENARARYQKLCSCLHNAGIAQKDALLVTEDAGLAGYVYDLRYGKPLIAGEDACEEETVQQEALPGMGVVFFEREGSRAEVSADMVVLGFEEAGVQFMDRVLKRRNRLPWNILYTRRTCVREITLGDLDELYRLYEGDGMTDYTDPLLERALEEAYTRSYIDYMYYYYGYGMWVVLDKETGKLIGRAGIEHRETQDGVLMELGYVIGTAYQKQGYATEVCQAIAAYAAEELGIEQLHCFIHPHNNGSLRVAQKLGFTLCAEPDAKQKELLHFCKNMGS
ncbi:MAG: GNAT family N-acetyltransferase [Eubacterium sp.]|nr:GNAT family N-acetyltransferase [Eubacterium sp.]